METNPNQEPPQGAMPPGSGSTATSTPPPPPPQQPPPPYLGYPPYPPYGMTAPPPRKGSGFWRIISILIGLLMLLILALLVLNTLPSGGRHWGFLTLTNKIGLLRIEGVISQSDDKRFWIEALNEMANRENIKGIVVRIDSPGGTVGASQELYQAILKVRQRAKKPVYVSMGDLAASGGYYTAAASDRIFANKGTLTGSIGVIFSKPQLAELTQKLGIQMETIKSGEFKDAGAMTRPMTPAEKEVFNVMIMNTYGQFIGDVLAIRKDTLAAALKKLPSDTWTEYKITPPSAPVTPEAYLRSLADGRVYTGEQALRLGLVDEIGTLEDTVESLGRKVGITGTPETYELTRKKGLSELLSNKVGNLLPSSRSPLQYMMNLP